MKTAMKGRGARSNDSGRYEADRREEFDDGWTDQDEAAAPLRTTLSPEHARTIIAKNTSPDVGFDRSINPYKGCEHGCIYCYARPSHAWMGLSPGLDFESRIFFKPEAARLLEQELAKPRYVCKRIHIGGNTDPYQPVERETQSTRSILQVMQRFRQPYSIITKSVLIARDADILGSMGRDSLASAFISITTLDRGLARAMEPRASTPAKRLEAISRLADAGCPVGVGFAPVIPGLNDHEMEAILEAAQKAGATSAMYVTLRLPLEIKDLFREWLADARPERAARVMSLIRQTRGGKDYDPDWAQRMKGTGPVAELIATRFKAAIKRYGLDAPRTPLDVTQFRVPPDMRPQMDLFDLAS
ncbi:MULTISPECIES: PA0069 family radical SAM protein [unclassified Brevundimonas]|uniref:PA0069 family radical SAM protein n=1 Tax=unclassified Brevundimonas TaxID=2622653 RepID=UPI000CFC4369|nr:MULTISPECIES: PA0069 family radical SAM protein [unclassified Brevundimonas]PRA34452.1 radical SAM protein [Brevundimonas sp. MYb27]PQZ84152.1 radical SAM protein [Brevundimonas sp. MYb31]PRB17875.1 radical SAM protein [Brevundimonas sp. MYb52]PRB38246.1 radical SAM protein [Brevundimonas sp. MYb46]PRB55973.1 radical SAM protein [Brevundimonas sp. MYb33]